MQGRNDLETDRPYKIFAETDQGKQVGVQLGCSVTELGQTGLLMFSGSYHHRWVWVLHCSGFVQMVHISGTLPLELKV